MSKKTSDPLSELQSLSLERRLALVDEDVLIGRNRFQKIPGHDLATVLGIGDSRHPGGDWSFVGYAAREAVEEYVQRWGPPSEVLYWLEGHVTKERFEQLIGKSDELDAADEPSFSFLSGQERRMVEEKIAQRELEGARDNGLNCLAQIALVAPSGRQLRFEGYVEDDGACLELLTPYDHRDGKFKDLTDYLTESW
jgi:hypothetical protein